MNITNTYPLKWVTFEIAVGYAPRAQGDIEAVKQYGVDAVLNLCAECYDLHEIEAAAGLSVHWLPISDEDVPEMDEAQDALDWLDKVTGEGSKVLVHCRFGIGRTGTMVTAWLLQHGHNLDDALDMLSHTPARPVSRKQWDFLQALSIASGKPAVARPKGLGKKSNRLGKFFRKYLYMQDYGSH